jgi:hypothetical protein
MPQANTKLYTVPIIRCGGGGYQLLGRGGVLKSDRALEAVLRVLDSRRTALIKSHR